jgi:hypothetical protein
MKHILSFLAGLLGWFWNGIVTGGRVAAEFFHDVHRFLDEKKVLGALYLIAPLVAVFVLPFDPTIVLVLLLIAVALYIGVPIGELIPPVPGIQGMGMFDLITNKANKGDPYRFFGAVFLLAGLTYVFGPLWSPDLQVHWEYLALIGLTGLALLGVALFGDNVAVSTPGSAVTPTPQPGVSPGTEAPAVVPDGGSPK